MRSHIDQVFAGVEGQTERLLALLRSLAILVLAVVYWVVGALDHGPAIMLPLIGLAVTTAAGFAVAACGWFRPWVPWLLTTLDVLLLTHCLAMLAIATGQPLQLALETPAASVIFVLLATAAIRHRPFLVLYTAALFLILWGFVWLLSAYAGDRAALPQAIAANLTRLAVVALVAIALFIAMTRARGALIASITEARLRANLSRYFSPQLGEELALAGEAARSCHSQKAAILFADLRGFTALAERMRTDEVADFLNEYRCRIAEALNRHHGMIDKFIGDGVMAVFGVPEGRATDARDAILGGLALVSAIDRWNAERRVRGLPAVAIGVGIHYGDVTVGALGDERRLEYTVIGDTVNTAARIEEETAVLETPILISEDVVVAAPGLQRELQLTALPTRSLRGRRRPVRLYQPRLTEQAPSKLSEQAPRKKATA